MTGIRAFVLCGGRGTRLQPVLPNTPKFLAPIGKRRFADHLLDYLQKQNVRDVVLCTGYGADQIEEYCQSGNKWGITIQYSRELSPMGTAGALKVAERFFLSDSLVLNGDSLINGPFEPIIQSHVVRRAKMTVAIVRVPDVSRFGCVGMNELGMIERFNEKATKGPGMINAGYYVINPSVIRELPPDKTASLELDIIPTLIGHGLFGTELHAQLRDIGTPSDLQSSGADFGY